MGAIAFSEVITSDRCMVKFLDLSHNYIKNKGGIALVKALTKSKTIYKLNIDFNDFTEEVGEALEEAYTKIQRGIIVKFEHNKISNARIKKITE